MDRNTNNFILIGKDFIVFDSASNVLIWVSRIRAMIVVGEDVRINRI